MPLPREQVYTTDDIYALPDGERAELIMVPVRFILLLLQSLLRKMIKTMLNQISV